MNFKIKVWNYRSVAMDCPVEMEIKNGITFIMGVNNVGKSNLLRFFFDFRNLIPANPISLTQVFGLGIGIPFDHVLNRKKLTDFIQVEFRIEDMIFGFKISSYYPNQLHTTDVSVSPYYSNFLVSNNTHVNIFNKLRNLFSDSFYVGPFRSNLTNTNGQNFDVSIGKNFLGDWSSWADSGDVLKMEKIEGLKHELRDLFGYSKFDIRLDGAKDKLIVNCDDGQFYLNDMGAGISQFIIVLANALIRRPSLLLIDEPEINLHPKLQEMFVQALAAKCVYGLIATSHSIGLARSAGADSIYSLTKDVNGRTTLSIYGDKYSPSITNSINELGYSQFVELGGNNILLVEGSTDIKCIKEILRKYGIDQYFITMDLGGSSLISETKHDELSELKRLNAKSYSVIFDSELRSAGEPLKEKLLKFKKMCEELGFNVFSTEGHATDNYITQSVINSEIGADYTALSKYENLNERPKENKWGKNLNWKMFREMKKSDFEGTELDKFIGSVLIPLTK